MIPAGFAKQSKVTRLGVSRRLALAHLERPFREVVEMLEKDRDLALSLAHVADVIGGHARSYQTRFVDGWVNAGSAPRQAVASEPACRLGLQLLHWKFARI